MTARTLRWSSVDGGRPSVSKMAEMFRATACSVTTSSSAMRVAHALRHQCERFSSTWAEPVDRVVAALTPDHAVHHRGLSPTLLMPTCVDVAAASFTTFVKASETVKYSVDSASVGSSPAGTYAVTVVGIGILSASKCTAGSSPRSSNGAGMIPAIRSRNPARRPVIPSAIPAADAATSGSVALRLSCRAISPRKTMCCCAPSCRSRAILRRSTSSAWSSRRRDRYNYDSRVRSSEINARCFLVRTPDGHRSVADQEKRYLQNRRRYIVGQDGKTREPSPHVRPMRLCGRRRQAIILAARYSADVRTTAVPATRGTPTNRSRTMCRSPAG